MRGLVQLSGIVDAHDLAGEIIGAAIGESGLHNSPRGVVESLGRRSQNFADFVIAQKIMHAIRREDQHVA